MSTRQTEAKITALYERLSRDDEAIGDSNSIVNQKMQLESYAAQHGFNNCVHYTDDGWSGGNFDRPDLKRLIADIEAGKVGCVITKDMSRIGRDYLQTGFYTEVLFRKFGVRFIAIGNSIDSADPSSSEFAPFVNIMSEWYLRDCSRKQRAAYQVRGKSGKHTSNHVIYGYRKDPEDKHHWLIDEEAAAVVRRIFQLSVEGHGAYEIARILRDERVDCPSYHMGRYQTGRWHTQSADGGQFNWYGNTVSVILGRPEYMGHTVNFRGHKESYKSKKMIRHAPEDWLIFENTHEAIVDPKTWELAQEVKRTVRRTDTIGHANPLTGLVFCADCGAKMYNHRGRRKDCPDKGMDEATGLYPSDSYDCSTYTLSFQNIETQCVSHYISTKALRNLILDTIKVVSAYAISNEAEFIEKVRAASEVRQAQAAKDLKRKIAKGQKRVKELDGLIKKLYEAYAMAKLTESRFDLLSAEYEQEQADLKRTLEEDQAALDAFAEDTAKVEQFMALAKKYTDFSLLTTPMIHEFIDKIYVHAPDRSTGERVQEVDIYLKFIGKFDVPLPEPTPEELAEEEWRRKKRVKAHEKYLRRKERKRLAALAEEQETA